MDTNDDVLDNGLLVLDTTVSSDLTLNTSTGTSWTSNDVTVDSTCYPNISDMIFGDSTGNEFQAIIHVGPMTLSVQENGDVEIVMETASEREEYHIKADKVQAFLRSIADVVVEGKQI